MSKKLLLSGLICMCSISIANALCTSPATLKCNCAHPIINSEGKLACGTSYCGNKKCMPDGSCCETEKYCEVGDTKYCCADNQTCDTTKGCIEAKADIETLCANAGGAILTASSGTFCVSEYIYTWSEAEEWCSNNGMTMPTMYEMCPDWDGSDGFEKCPELSGTGTLSVWSASIFQDYEEVIPISVSLLSGFVFGNDLKVHSNNAFCH